MIFEKGCKQFCSFYFHLHDVSIASLAASHCCLVVYRCCDLVATLNGGVFQFKTFKNSILERTNRTN